MKFWGKIDNVIRENENVISDLKTSHQNFENVLSKFMCVVDFMYALEKCLQVEQNEQN